MNKYNKIKYQYFSFHIRKLLKYALRNSKIQKNEQRKKELKDVKYMGKIILVGKFERNEHLKCSMFAKTKMTRSR